ncbi:MAG: MFS transporter [Rubricella sp.]
MLIPLLSAANFVIGMGVFVAVGLLNPIAAAYGLSPAEAGWVMTIFALAYAVGSPLAIALTGAWPRARVLTLGMALFAAGAILCAVAPDYGTLLIARVVMAFGAGMFTPVTAGVAAATAAPERQGKALAAVFAGLTIAQVAGVPAGSWIGYTFGWQTAFIITGGLAALAAVAVFLRVPGDLPFRAAGLATLGRVLATPRLMLVILFTASFLGAIYIVYTYMAPLLSEGMGYGRDGITAALVLFGLGAVLGNIMGGFLSDRIGAGRTLAILCVAQAILMPAFSFLPMPGWALWLLVLLWAVFGWSFVAAQQIRVVRAGGEAANVALALNAASIYVGAALGGAIGGFVIAQGGLGATGWVAGLAALFALAHLALSERLSPRPSGETS